MLDATANHAAEPALGLDVDDRVAEPSILDRPLDLARVTWGTVAWVGAAALAVAFRFANLDVWALSPDEARRAFDAWALHLGRPPLPGQDLPDTAPLFLLLQALGFFLFGTTDAVARVVPALLGLGMLGLVAALRPFAGRDAALGMALLVAGSPVLVFSARLASPEILVAFLALLRVVAVLRSGLPTEAAPRRWGPVAGFAAGAMLAAGPSAVSVLLTLAAGAIFAAALDGGNAINRGLARLTTDRGALLATLAALISTLLTAFTRLFSDLGALAGLGETFADWGRLLAEGPGGTPPAFMLLAMLLYEPLALLIGLVAAIRGRVQRGGLGWPFLGAWFVAALVLWSLSAETQPRHAVHVALPLVLLGGAVLGELIASLDRRSFGHGRGWLLLLVSLGLLVSAAAFATLVSRVSGAELGDDFVDRVRAPEVVEPMIVGVVVLIPLALVAGNLIVAEIHDGRGRQAWRLVLLAVVIPLAAYGMRSSVLLNFYTADEGSELLAQRWPTAGVRPTVDGIRRLSRDVTVLDGSVRDPTGGHGLTIAVERDVRWPFQWYFRDFPNFTVVDDGQGALSEAQVVLAKDETGLAEAGYTIRTVGYLHRVPGAYDDPDGGGVIADLFDPGAWVEGVRYLLYRDGLVTASPLTVTSALDRTLSERIAPTSEVFDLDDREGSGQARGQFNLPVGVAVAPAGPIYVVDGGNVRVQRFDDSGTFIGSWGADAESGVTFTAQFGGGPTGITVSPDGLVYVADTWGHRVVAINARGDLIREFGGFAETTDDPAAVETEPGKFFGPRAIAVSADGQEIFVADTGNERVQVFAPDGTFLRAFGGYGSGPDRLIEPVGLAIGPNGFVYVADSGNARISVFTPSGTPVAQWPVESWPGAIDGAPPSNQPYLAFGPDGLLYATSSTAGRVEVFGPDGALLRSITSVDDEPLSQPLGIAAAPDGTLLITDQGLSAVLRYTPPPTDPVSLPPGDPPADAPTGAAPTTQPLPRPPGVADPGLG